jgi:hypothetical protein
MADDFRIKVEFEDEGSILHFGRSLQEREFENEVREHLGDGVIVSRDGPEVYLYASPPEQACAAECRCARGARAAGLRREGLTRRAVAPHQERWEAASEPLPQSPAEVATEQAREETDEAQESRELGYAEWEVRATVGWEATSRNWFAPFGGFGTGP